MSESAKPLCDLQPPARSIPDRGRRQALPVPPLTAPCDCPVPVRCATNGNGYVEQVCLRCGETNIVGRRAGIPTISKARAAELKMFGPGERS